MKQADLGLNLTTKRTRKRKFLDEMERVVPWQALVDLITPFAPDGKRGRPPFPVETMLRIHFMQQWFTLSDRRAAVGHRPCRPLATKPGLRGAGLCRALPVLPATASLGLLAS